MAKKNKARATTGKNMKPGLAAPASAPGPEMAKMSRVELVRSLPADMPSKEVVARARQAGITISEAYVYNIRYEAKKAGKVPSANGRHAQVQRTVSPAARVTGVEDILRAAASEIGLSRAISILEDQQSMLRHVLRQ